MSEIAVARLENLRQANEVRYEKARLKKAVAVGRRDAGSLILEPPASIRNTPVCDVLRWKRGIGEVRARQILAALEISPVITIAQLTDRRRRALAEALA